MALARKISRLVADLVSRRLDRTGDTTPGGAADAILLGDGSSGILLGDGTSNILMGS